MPQFAALQARRLPDYRRRYIGSLRPITAPYMAFALLDSAAAVSARGL